MMYISKCALALSLVVVVATAADVDLPSNTNQSSSSSLRGRLSRFLTTNSKKTTSSPPDATDDTNTITNNETYEASSSSLSRNLATGCYDSYVTGPSYLPGSFVSAKVGDKQAISYPTYTRDPDTGAWVMDVVDTPETFTYYNYQCIENSIRCGDVGYGIGEAGESLAWKRVGECDPTVDPPEIECDLWDEIGCPVLFDSKKAKYEGGEIVEFEGRVYQCAAAPQNMFCSMDGYEPNKNVAFSTVWVWELLGCCSGTLSPTPNPAGSWEDVGGCFCEYDETITYVAGDKISKRKYGSQVIYQCKGAPMDQFCSMTGYEPGTDEEPQYWREAWSIIGTCDGTNSPTAAPNMVDSSLVDWGGCPPEWDASITSDPDTTYEAGDAISLNGLVYKCKGWPYSGHCGQDGYKPKEDPATPGAWKEAWTLVGYCFGTMAPTMAPHFEELKIIDGGCPDGWDSSESYEEADLVSVVVSEGFEAVTTTRKPTSAPVVPTPRPTSQYCFSPTSSPTQRPTRRPTKQPATKPTPPPGSGARRMNSDTADDGERTVVYKCKEWPYTPYCSQFDPSEGLGWTVVGFCRGSRAPTGSPVQYTGTCQFNKCVIEPEGGDPVPCVIGQQGCTCDSEGDCTKRPDLEVCTLTDVEPFSGSAEYVEGDVVRIGTKRFKCKGWPNSGWCSDAGYEPSLNPGLWEQAWDENGECEIETNPTGSPTSNPTELPTGSPTSNPTELPTGSPTSNPTELPTGSPTSNPTDSPTRSPTSQPTSNPTAGCIPSGGPCDMNQQSSCCSNCCEGSTSSATCG